MNKVLHVTDETFTSDVLEASGITVVDFWAEWCGPCKSMNPLLEQLANDKQGQLKVMKMNIDQSLETPAKYGIRGIPTLMAFKDGELTATKIGSLSRGQLYTWIEGVLSD